MIAEVRGANMWNKGAELMLRAIAAELEGAHQVAVAPAAGPYPERARMGLLQTVTYRRVDPWLEAAGRALPRRVDRHLLLRYGLVLERGVSAILDASGFAYSDRFALRRSVSAADRIARDRRRGKRIVLLPQAYGPFECASRREAFVRIVENSDLVYARDRISLDHARGTGAPVDRIRLAPDFTCLIEGQDPPGFEAPERLALVVPSAKVMTETPAHVRTRYLPFLAAAIALLREAGFDVRLLVHELGDLDTVEALQSRLPRSAPIIRHANALHLKGVIGRARVVVGSRFHALVSALSQGVPSLCVGWSHKYEMLFEDYDSARHVVEPSIEEAELADHLRELTEEPSRSTIVAGLDRCAAREREGARQMWSDVRSILDSPVAENGSTRAAAGPPAGESASARAPAAAGARGPRA